jgi:hypothetical protein
MAMVPSSWKEGLGNPSSSILSYIEVAINEEIKASKSVISKHGENTFPELDSYIEGLEKALKIINKYK